MSTWTREEVTVRYTEYTVPVGAYGATAHDVEEAIGAAKAEILRRGEQVWDDSLRVSLGDDAIVIRTRELRS